MTSSRRLNFKYFVVILFLLAFAVMFIPFYSELALAAVFAFAMEPSLGRLLHPRHLRWKMSVAAILFLMFLGIALPISFVLYRTYRYLVKLSESGVQNSELFQKAALIKEKVANAVDRVGGTLNLDWQFEISSTLDEGLNKVFEFFVKQSGAVVTQVPSLMISIFVFCAALYYFLAEGRTIKGAFMKQRLLTPNEASRFIDVIQQSCFATVVTSIIIAFMQASIVGVGALIFDTGDFAVIWVLTFFFSFIPVIGAGPVAVLMAIYHLLMDNYGGAVGFLVVAVIAGTADNLVRPYLISTQDQDLHPVVMLLAIIGALLVFGMPGLFLGPVIASVAIKIIPTLFDEEGPAKAKD